jgi:outer membrane cobalamin receptor
MMNAVPRPFRRHRAPAMPALAALLAAVSLSLRAQAPPPAVPAAPPALATSRDFTFAAEDQPARIDQIAGHIQVFILEDLERSGARTLGEFLAQELPAQFQQTGGPGLPTRAYQGGARPQDTLVLLDGMRMADPNQSAPDLNAIPLTGIVRVEILTGTDSARRGPGAQGGIVAIYTSGATDKASSGELAGQGGSGGQSQGRVLPSFGWGDGWIHAGSQARQEDQATDTTKGFRSATNFMGFGQRMGPALLSLSYRNHYQGVPDPYATATILNRVYDPSREAGYRSQSGALGLRFDLAPGAALVFSAGVQSVDRKDPLPGTDTLQRTTGRTTQADLAFVVGVPGFGLTLHTGGFEERGQQPVQYVGTDEGRARHSGIGLEATFQPVPILRFTTEAGFQSDQRRLDPVGLGASERTDRANTFRATVNLSLPFGFRMYAGGGQGYTAPSLPQLLLNARAGGPELNVEKNGFGFAGFGWGKGNWSGRLESNRASYRDAIGFDGAVYRNQDHARIQGTEATLAWTKGGFGAEGFARSQDARDLNAPDDPHGTPAAANRPFLSHGIKVFAGWSHVRLDVRYRTVGANYQWVGSYNCDNLLPNVVATGVVFREVATTATVTLGKHWTLIARGEHLLQPKTSVDQWLAMQTDLKNDAYRAYGIPAPGPSGSLEVLFRY